MDIAEIERKYNACPPAKDNPGERGWTDRTDTFASFMQNGRMVLDSLRTLDADELETCRSAAPERWALLFEVFG